MRTALLALVLGTVLFSSHGALASHRADCAQSHAYHVGNDTYIVPEQENLDFGVPDHIELYCAAGWDGWPELEFESVSGEPCWWMSMESFQVANLTIGTACLTPPHVAVSTAGVVHAT